MWKNVPPSLLLCFALFLLILATGCETKQEALTVYAGKGLKSAMEEVRGVYTRNYGVKLDIVYAGSNTLLKTIQKTSKGDLFLPGAVDYLKKAEQLVVKSYFVTNHVPVFTVRQDNPKKLRSFADLAGPGVKLAVGNKEMCACGKVADVIVYQKSKEIDLARNVVIKASTVNELLSLVLEGEVDGALVWGDMLTWPEAAGLMKITIPPPVNEVEEIHVGVLSTTTDRRRAMRFAEFLSTEGQAIFEKHGFGGR